ncbi:predicted protein [Uncinocarpus reesii 1704]|uniref:Uncharacterized protein n=1 Tax=Uncinocarpus reesii (strain UAMH 1704) TaxID=336963 RepID=C4JKZ7_UNCRE|nr:uncharacterized protein UREG_00212 [Uncinocarpus reesii 1704]EEP75366.1 predicted protein [Uncinocarpus reesii 1704]
MAKYTLFRATLPDPQIGGIIKTLIGADETAAEAYKNVERETVATLEWMRVIVNEMGQFKGIGPNDQTMIKCGAADMVPIQHRPGFWFDREYPMMSPVRPATNRRMFCDPEVSAFTYIVDEPNGRPEAIVVICMQPDGPFWPHGRIRVASEWNEPLIEGESLDIFENHLSLTLLHEFMHAAGVEYFPPILPDDVGEAYGVGEISRLTTEQKRMNADGYALLATAIATMIPKPARAH